MRTFASAAMALVLSISNAAAQSTDENAEAVPNFCDRVISLQITDTGEGSPALYVTFQNLGIMHVGRDPTCDTQNRGYCVSDGAFAAMAAVLSTAIQSHRRVSGFRWEEQPRRGREPSYRLNWVRMEAHQCTI